MATSANASHTPPGSTVASSPTFQTYKDYLNHLRTSEGRRYIYNNLAELLGGDYSFPYNEHQYLWLLRFQADGNPALSYRYGRSGPDGPKAETQSPDIDPAAYPAYEVVTSSNEFQDLIGTFDEKTEYQVVIWQLGRDNTPHPHIINILGMGLDMEPDVLEYICSMSRGRRNSFPVPWINKDKFMEIGKNSMVVLQGLSTKRPKTAIVFLKQDSLSKDDDVQVPILYPPKRPSDGMCSIPRDTLQQAPMESTETWALRRYILAAGKNMENFGTGNFLFACLDGLLRLYLATLPRSVPNFDIPHEGLDPKYMRYWSVLEKYWLNPMGTARRSTTIEPHELWRRLGIELDAQKLALMRLPDFVRLNFALRKGPLRKKFKELERMYEIHTKELEIAEARLRDHIEMFTSYKSTEMAEKSIEESKKVILLTWVALVFIPLSFASSIYGMNIQQINKTGHSIRAFIITAITLLATTFLIWGGVAGIAAYRNHRHITRHAEHWIDKLLFVYNVFKEIWGRLSSSYKYGWLRILSVTTCIGGATFFIGLPGRWWRYLRKKARKGNPEV